MKHFKSILIALLMVVMGATAMAQAPIPIGPYGNLPFNASHVAVATAALPAYDFVGLLTGGTTAPATYTTDTAANFCKLFPFIYSSAARSYNWDLWVKNTSVTSSATVTISAGSGMTLVGTGTALIGTVRHFKVSMVSCTPGSEAGNLYSLETSAF